MPRNFSFTTGYGALLIVSVLLVYGLLHLGQSWFPPLGVSDVQTTAVGRESWWAALQTNLREPISLLLMQIVVIIVVARACGRAFARLGQPAVVGEIIAGILLGPSALGWLWPELMHFLFPPEALGSLKLLSMLGVMLFMFVVGMDLDLQELRQRAKVAVVVSHVSIAFPFLLGVLLSFALFTTLAPAGIPFMAFSLFTGIAMSITAFPVLARIIHERGLAGTTLGHHAIACAAVDDVSAWCLLALVIALVKSGSFSGAIATLLLTAGLIAFMLLWVRPRADALLDTHLSRKRDGNGGAVFASMLVLMFASALAAELIGIHAIFGAFLAGVALSARAELRSMIRERLETFSSAFLLPLFFAFTGLRTQFALLHDWQSWLLCAGIILVAIAGKLGGSTLAARWAGMRWREASALGVLMNTRGLMELVVLNIGYDLGVISARMFAMLVLMALVTTFMTGPLVGWLLRPPASAARPRAG